MQPIVESKGVKLQMPSIVQKRTQLSGPRSDIIAVPNPTNLCFSVPTEFERPPAKSGIPLPSKGTPIGPAEVVTTRRRAGSSASKIRADARRTRVVHQGPSHW